MHDRRVEPTAAQLADAASHPHWLVERWLARFGPAETEALLRWNNTRPRLVLQPAREPAEELERRWRAAGNRGHPGAVRRGADRPTGRGRRTCPAMRMGDFRCRIRRRRCSPGTRTWRRTPRSTTRARRPAARRSPWVAASARVVAGDASRARMRRLAGNLRRAGSGREFAIVADALAPPVRPVDAVLVDAPCLGTGTFARHPDARWRVTPRSAGVARRASGRAARPRVRGRGWRAGSCSTAPARSSPRRTPSRWSGFWRSHPEYRREPSETFPATLTSPEGDLMILPHRHQMDGAFAARLRRTP